MTIIKHVLFLLVILLIWEKFAFASDFYCYPAIGMGVGKNDGKSVDGLFVGSLVG